MTEQERMKRKANIQLSILVIFTTILCLGGYLSVAIYVRSERINEVVQIESSLSVGIKNQCEQIAKSQERTLIGGMTSHSSFGSDYKECITRSAIHKQQYGKEDLIKS
jgi:hypothetical protein